MGIVTRSKNVWAIRLTKNKGIFFIYQGRESYGSLRSWGWAMFDFLDHTDFEKSYEFFGLSVQEIVAVR